MTKKKEPKELKQAKEPIEIYTCPQCYSELDHSQGRANYKCHECGSTWKMRTRNPDVKTNQITVIDYTGRFDRVMAKVKAAVLDKLAKAEINNPFDTEYMFQYVPGNPFQINPDRSKSENTEQRDLKKKLNDIIWEVFSDEKPKTMTITQDEVREILTAFFIAAIQKDKPAFQDYVKQDKKYEQFRGKELNLVTPGKHGELTTGQAFTLMTQIPRTERSDMGKNHSVKTDSKADNTAKVKKRQSRTVKIKSLS